MKIGGREGLVTREDVEDGRVNVGSEMVLRRLHGSELVIGHVVNK
jgi:hypothetical protein